MMHSTLGMQAAPGLLPVSSYPHHDAFLDDLSTQMAVSQATRRLSRGSSGQRPSSMMRVSKPTSASNSPRSSMALSNRRRTMINDGYVPRRQQQQQQIADHFQAPISRSNRPVSWHPSTQMQQLAPQYQPTLYAPSTPSMYADQQEMYASQPQFSPMLASYSNNTSPASAFSPLPLAYQGTDATQYFPSDSWELGARAAPFHAMPDEKSGMPEPFPAYGNPMGDTTSTTNMDWNAFILHGFNNTSPPTPDSFLPPQPLQPAVSEASDEYRSRDEPEEDEGEILVGMGLYDPPEKYEEDPHLNNYRSTVSSLLGSTFRPREPQGKGLKLEETWEPPKSEDEDDDEDQDDESGDEDDDEDQDDESGDEEDEAEKSTTA